MQQHSKIRLNAKWKPTSCYHTKTKVPYLYVLFLPVAFYQVPDDRPFGMPEHQTATRILLDGEEFQRLAEHPVVAPLRLLQLQRVRLQLLRSFPRSAINALFN